MRLVIAALFVTLLAPARADACEDEDGQATYRHDRDQVRARQRAQRDAMRQARRARREPQRQPFAQPPPRPPQPMQPIDPYQDPRAFKYKAPKVKEKDPKDHKDKIDKLQKKLDKLRDRLEKFQVPKTINEPAIGPAPAKRPMRIEIQPTPYNGGIVTIDVDDAW